MKNIKFLSLFALIFMLFACNEAPKTDSSDVANAADATVEVIESINKVEVIGFHSTHRCATCKAIESNTQFTLDTYFSEQVKNGTITYQTLNVEEEANYTKAEEFQATGTSLYLNVIVDNQNTIINLTNFAFSDGRDQEIFSEELKLKIDQELKKI